MAMADCFYVTLWLRYLKKQEILSDLVRKNVAKFSDKFFHFPYATLEKCKGH